jgi:hypothetical protein
MRRAGVLLAVVLFAWLLVGGVKINALVSSWFAGFRPMPVAGMPSSVLFP